MVGALYFSAPWCGPCKTFGPTMETVTSDLGVDLQKINVDVDAKRADEFGVMSIPTTVWFKDGEFKKFQPGPMNEASLRDLIINL